MSHHRTFEILTAEPVPSRRKPRHRSDEEKARLVAEAFSPGGNVSVVARSEGWTPRSSMRGAARRFRRAWLRH